jgi:glycosyltransferase involved in cell wall biosynthesis
MREEWQVPAFREFALRPREHDHALVIPVINEGERVRGQLVQLRTSSFPIDIVIADGGSTDGSLDPAFLESVGVAALLVKTGPGRLSAQLRMAYAWCLERGYAGVITVDGNGKDGMEAIPLFLDRLREGYDLVQGSRYVKGGSAINTPLDRELAGRFIHAPLISLAAGRRFTDTTNGFRGYSARVLNDPRVAPFREVFSTYELLFYLSVRIPKLGYRAIEVPVTRSYPANAKTPTKITGMRGRWSMLAELFGVVLGRLNPP